jgi:hypothetical protein
MKLSILGWMFTSTLAPCSLNTVRASLSSRSPANFECRRWSELRVRLHPFLA